MYDVLAAGNELSSVAVSELHECGFVVLPGPVESADMERVAIVYDAMLASASAHDVHAGSTTTRVNGRRRRRHFYLRRPQLNHT